METLIMENDGGQEIRCYNKHGKLVLVIEDAKDVPAMKVVDLDPYNDDDLFTYANHLLGGRFNAYSTTAI